MFAGAASADCEIKRAAVEAVSPVPVGLQKGSVLDPPSQKTLGNQLGWFKSLYM